MDSEAENKNVESLNENAMSQNENQILEQNISVSNFDSKKDTACSIHETNNSLSICKEDKTVSSLQDIPKPVVKKHEECVKTPEAQVTPKFYAVSFPALLSTLNEDDHPLIFTNKIDALRALKKYPDARFREFNSRIEALRYASLPLSVETAPSTKETGEKSLFKSISSQEMVQLRRAIESGNEGVFLEKVWSNPRYLINNADGPTVMQEGTRYNALHVAARFRQTGMCLTVLSVINDKQFVSTLYPEDKPSMIEERTEHLVDLYLNMPDKTLSETPLHFACKFGADSILAILLSYPKCDINKLNKYGSSPKDIICNRHLCTIADHKKRMQAMFEDIFYVPIVRDEIHNFVGELCHASAVLTAISCSPDSGSVAYCAFAGPMSESAASKFCTVLKTKRITENTESTKIPFSPEEKTLVQICLSDSKKGLERVGRKLAKDLSIEWLEFWSPLDCWIDLSSEFGLDCLNDHLKKMDEMVNSEDLPCPSFEELIISFTDDFVQKLPVILVNMNKLTFFHLFQTLIQHMSCFIKFIFSCEKEISLIHEETGHLLSLKLSADDSNNFNALKFYLNTQFNIVGCLQAPKWKMFLCILKFACYFQASNSKFLKLPVCNCQFLQKSDFYDYSAKSCYLSILSLRQEFSSYQSNTTKNNSEKCNVEKESSSLSKVQKVSHVDNKEQEALTEPHMLLHNLSLDCELTANCDNEVEKPKQVLSASGIYNFIKKLSNVYNSPSETAFKDNLIKSGSSVEEEDNFFTPPESPSNRTRKVFVNDQELSDDDIDIFRAIVDAGVRINKIEYPYLFKWKSLMESTLEPVLKPDDKISCTPTSSSARVRKAVTPGRKDPLKRTLF